ncbi:MAG: alpha/beta hydrolase [Planctomycetota bacterium]
MHWIITNRLVVREDPADLNSREYVVTDVNDALPTFRVAKFEPMNTGELKNGQSIDETKRMLDHRVEFLPDLKTRDYLDPVRSVDERAASAQMFRAIYGKMIEATRSQPRSNIENREASVKGDVLFFMHGFNYSWDDALINLQALHNVYVENPLSPISQIVYFTWPSYGSLARYPSDQAIAQPSGVMLGRFWGKTVGFFQRHFKRENGERQPFCDRKIHLAAHSMGNQVLEYFMAAIIRMRFMNLSLFGEVLLLHADAAWDALETGKPLSYLPEYSDRIHIYNHHSDDALLVSELTKNSEKRLGRHGPRDLEKIPPRSLVVDCTANIPQDQSAQYNEDDPMTASMASILGEGGDDVLSTRERMFNHWGYLQRRSQIEDITRVLRGESASAIRTRQQKADRLFSLTKPSQGRPQKPYTPAPPDR